MPNVVLSAAQQPVLLLFFLIGAGSLIGHVKVRGVGLGAAAVLFLAIGVSAWGTAHGRDLELPEEIGTLGLALFTFSVGIVSGATFFTSLRHSLRLIAAIVAVLACGAGAAVLVGGWLDLSPAVVAGAFAGAVTNTPALAAAREAAGDSDAPTVGYAVTYLYGVIGMLGVVTLALRRSGADDDAPPALVNRTVRVELSSAPSIKDVESRHGDRVTFSRLRHGEAAPVRAAGDTDTLLRDDLVTVVGPLADVQAVTEELGHASSHHLEADRSYLDLRRITISNARAAGRTVADLQLAEQFGARISRVRRGDVDMVASDDFHLQLGDRVRVVAPPDRMKEVSAFLGDSARGLSDITPVILGLGIALGVLIGALAFPIGSHTLAIGSAAGSLIVGLVLGRIGRVGPFVTSMPNTAANAMGELGLLFFLAQAGTRAGAQIGEAFTSGEWIRILLLGFVVTTLVGAGLYVVLRHGFRVSGPRLAGIVSGAQTQPAVLAYANGRTMYDSRVALGYALIYPAAMIAKILLGQVLGGL
ncbi:aspartate:alanine exchanger family transporter [Cellulomonas soli]|uniref:Putative transporter n=1 Tax=Cellulomonas soli TaxID=931535 RepID=A0A512PBK6_9CELL|nr:TrkA C-terminal domain-containing protein [Cellulomonas soli]NYI61000.1 putative transport protein [Cellulomonas soli]GEP68585.1 putative transporter [Cellulomonas soli]